MYSRRLCYCTGTGSGRPSLARRASQPARLVASWLARPLSPPNGVYVSCHSKPDRSIGKPLRAPSPWRLPSTDYDPPLSQPLYWLRSWILSRQGRCLDPTSIASRDALSDASSNHAGKFQSYFELPSFHGDETSATKDRETSDVTFIGLRDNSYSYSPRPTPTQQMRGRTERALMKNTP